MKTILAFLLAIICGYYLILILINKKFLQCNIKALILIKYFYILRLIYKCIISLKWYTFILMVLFLYWIIIIYIFSNIVTHPQSAQSCNITMFCFWNFWILGSCNEKKSLHDVPSGLKILYMKHAAFIRTI